MGRYKRLSVAEIRRRAKAIGDDSWELVNFVELPRNASRTQMITALRHDSRWMEDKANEIVCAIGRLTGAIANGEER